MRVKLTLAATCALAVLVSAGPAARPSPQGDDDKVQCKTPTRTPVRDRRASTGRHDPGLPGTYPARSASQVITSTRCRAEPRSSTPQRHRPPPPTQRRQDHRLGRSARLKQFVGSDVRLRTADGAATATSTACRIVEARPRHQRQRHHERAPVGPGPERCQYGIPSASGATRHRERRQHPATTGTGTVTNNDIHGYAQARVYVDNNTTKATSGTTRSPARPAWTTSRRTDQVSRGAKAPCRPTTIKNNCHQAGRLLATGSCSTKPGTARWSAAARRRRRRPSATR